MQAQEKSHGEYANMNQGSERNANIAGGWQRDVPECTASGVSGCSDEDGAGADDSDFNAESSVCSITAHPVKVMIVNPVLRPRYQLSQDPEDQKLDQELEPSELGQLAPLGHDD